MIYDVIPIRVEGSAEYARLHVYIWDYSASIPLDRRPLVLILPGGGYHKTSDREAEAVALNLMAMGYHTAVLRYTVAPDGYYPVSLYETASAVALLKARADDWRIDPDRLVVLGFSAGGHLAASFGVFWNREDVVEAGRRYTALSFEERAVQKKGPVLKEQERGTCAVAEPGMGIGSTDTQTLRKGQEVQDAQFLRPAGLLLGYPVITSREDACHEESIRNLLGDRVSDEGLRRQMSLENQVGKQVPRCFVWNTFEDESVPPVNSMLWVQALMEKHIPVEYHLYEKGGHGLSLANELTDNLSLTRHQEECQSWLALAGRWLKNLPDSRKE